MTTTVDRIGAKVTRAKQNVEDFQLAVRAFAETKPYAVGIKVDSQAGNASTTSPGSTRCR